MATEVKKAVDLGLLEEDDEFEEFPAESKWYIRQDIGMAEGNGELPLRLTPARIYLIKICKINILFIEWEAKDEDPTDVNVWEDNWDDDTVEDDFSIQLR